MNTSQTTPKEPIPYTAVFDEPSAKRVFVRRMFDGIAGTYDLLNHLLSAGIDVVWRRKTIDALAPEPGWRILDLATGTGDLGFEAAKRDTSIRVTGADLSIGMMRLGHQKAKSRDPVGFVAGDAEGLPFPADYFDGLTIGFGIRNVANLDVGLREMTRVLKSKGRVAILEFSKPKNPVMCIPYFLYFRHILPRIGRLVSKDAEAYRYLYDSVMRFPEGEEFCVSLRNAGFQDVHRQSLSFGIATIYTGHTG